MYRSLLRHASSEAIAIRFENKEVTYKELLANIRKMVSFCRRLGVREGDVVTLSLPNVPTGIYALYALNAIGAVLNIIHPLSPVQEILRTARETDSKLIVALSTLVNSHGDAFAQSGIPTAFANPMADVSFLMKTLCYVKYGKAKGKDGLYDLEDYRREKEDHTYSERKQSETCLYLHSGGTTGASKIIELSADALNNLVARSDGLLPYGIAGKSILAVLPAFHGFGLGMGIHAPLYWGATSALMTKFDVAKTLKWIHSGKVNVILGVPLLYQKLMKHPAFAEGDLSHIECAFVGGDNVPPSLIESFNALMEREGSVGRMLEGYGLTETVTVCAVNTHKAFRMGSVGKPLEGIEVTVRDEEQNLLPAGQVGEVYIAGDTLMNGYYKDPEATGKTILKIDGKDWVRSGDLGYLDEEGYLFLKGRIKRVYKIAGINVYPAEVEKIATDLTEDIYDAALELFDTPKPHLTLFLIRNKNSSRAEEELKEEILSRIGGRMTKYCMPEKVIFLDAFPKTKVGKIDHKAMKE
ncbi:MAG: acyl--CoA ligase [Clostridia bacterium]|nr:acyl--CoA ligase [Clostridia bacterium]